MVTNILIVGVGGQGTLLASRILGAFASLIGKDCKLSEVHGMSQRGGSVVTHVRIGDEVLSPIIEPGDADFILAFEKLEAFRWRHYLKNDGTIICNDQEIMPMPVIIGAAKYTEHIFHKIANESKKIIVINALESAKLAGNAKAVNTVMIGVLAKVLGVKEDLMEQALTESVPAKLLEVNKKALKLGYQSK